jgi:NADH pyrophosphatase NudC (nudix superfamily)
MKKQIKKAETMKISFDDVPTKTISNEKKLVGNQEKVSLSFPSSDSTQKKDKKSGGLLRLFHKKSAIIIPSQPPILPEKVEESDEVAILENEIRQKLELIKQKQEEKRLKIEKEKKDIEEEKKRIELEKIDEKKKAKKLPKKIICKTESTNDFNNLEELSLIPKNIGTAKFCEKCGSKMKKKWVKMNGNIYTQQFTCKNKNCRNIKLLEIKI